MEEPNSIYSLIEHDHFRKRPSMYLRGNRILDLVKLIDAYQLCERHNKLDTGLDDFFNDLAIFILEKLSSKYPEKKGGNYHWYQMIEILANTNIENEIPIFFELYDEFLLSKCS